MLSGIVLISLPVAVVGAKFQQAYEDFEADEADIIALGSRHQSEGLASPRHSKRTDSDIKRVKVGDVLKPKQASSAFVVPEAATSSSSSHWSPGEGTSGQRVRSTPSATCSDPRVADLRNKLQLLETRHLLSPSALDNVQLLLELLDHVERADQQLAGLRAKDHALDALIHRDF